MMNELDAFTALLYDHKFDVDDIILALCGNTHKGRWLLNTRTNTLIAEDVPPPPHTAPIQDGDDSNHWHIITPLPATFLADITKTPAFERLTGVEQTALRTRLEGAQSPADLPQWFEEDFLGGWLRERVKDAALKWLDSKNLIPPSMRHVYHRHNIAQSTPPPKKVTIS